MLRVSAPLAAASAGKDKSQMTLSGEYILNVGRKVSVAVEDLNYFM